MGGRVSCDVAKLSSWGVGGRRGGVGDRKDGNRGSGRLWSQMFVQHWIQKLERGGREVKGRTLTIMSTDMRFESTEMLKRFPTFFCFLSFSNREITVKR